MVEFGWQELVGLFVGLLIVGGSVAWGLRHSSASIADIQRDVAAFDAVLRALETPELRVYPGPVYEHPMVGVIPSHSTLVGTLSGYALHVELHNPEWDAETHPEYFVRARVTALPGHTFYGPSQTSAPHDWTSQGFDVQIEGRSLVVTETPGRKSTTGVELRASAADLGAHLHQVTDFARRVAVAAPALASRAPPDAMRTALSGKQVFLLDGDLRFAEMLRDGLLSCGAQPRLFADFQSLIGAAERNEPDLFVVSLELPGENGWGVCNRLKKHEQLGAVPLIVLSTGSGEAEFQMHQRLRTRAQDYVAKPVSVDEMLARIGSQCAQRGTV